MSTFKKPKKNLRIRNVDDDKEENSEEPMELDGNNGVKFKNKKTEKLLPTKKSTLLSFGDDEEEEEEVFQVKKSSQSKKLIRMLDKERKKKKTQGEKTELDAKISNIKINIKNDDDDDNDIVVVEKKNELTTPIVLNGRAALVVGKNDVSSSDEDDVTSTKHKFANPDHVKIFLRSGTIPDAATIHAARKRRQRARELGTDYIQVSNRVKNDTTSKSNKSRLIRDDDNDRSDEDDDEEDRLDMAVNLEQKDRNAMRENYEKTVFNNEDDDVDDEWETQQIKKGVQITACQSMNELPPPPPPIMYKSASYFSMSDSSPAIVVSRLQERLNELKEMNDIHLRDKSQVLQDLEDCISEKNQLEEDAPKLADRFRFYQELRGYITDLIECFDEKIPRLVSLEEKILSLWSERNDKLCERRQQDIRDQVDELSRNSKNSGAARLTKDEEEMRSRRAAEREGRRTRRRRLREMKGINVLHVDGMSSDDEFTELESTSFRIKLDEVNQLSKDLMEDVEDDFGTIDGITRRMEKWRNFDYEAYTEAYASLCLPKLLGPIVRLHLLTWTPLQSDCIDYETTSWWGRLLLYSVAEGETIDSLLLDPDVQLVPMIVEKIIIPKLKKIIEDTWDPMSSSQTLRIVGLLSKLVNETPTLLPTSKQLELCFQTVLNKIKHSVDNDVFLPIHLKMLSDNKSNSLLFFQRQFSAAVKLLRNILSYQGLIGSEKLQELALDSLLNRYLLAALRTCQPSDAICKSNVILSTFPRWWFQGETKIHRLSMFGNYLKQLSTQVQEFDTTEKESYETVHSLLRTLAPTIPDPTS